MRLGSLIIGLGSLVGGVHALRDGMKPVAPRKPANRIDLGQSLVPAHRNGPPLKAQIHKVNSIGARVKHIIGTIQKSRQDPNVRAFAVKAVSKKRSNGRFALAERDYEGELKAVFGDIRSNVRYVRDGHKLDTFQSARRTLEFGGGDCFPEGTLFLARDGFVPVESVEVGDEIHDGEQWVEVLKTWDRGPKRILKFTLNNGSILCLSDTHKMLRVPRQRPDLPGKYEQAEEVVSSEIRVGDDLLQPRGFAGADDHELPEDVAFLIGAYIAEGCRTSRKANGKFNEISISGIPNGKMVRERVIEILERNGVQYRSLERDVRFHADAFPVLMDFGRIALEKRLPTFRFGPRTVSTILRAMEMGDGGVATNEINMVYSTISALLALQYRVLQRFMGRSASHHVVTDHGGFGKNPIHRLTVRVADERRPWAKVKKIEAEDDEVLSYDVMTTSGRVYLPESDVITRQCDDYTITMGAALQSIGYPVKLRIVQTKGSQDFNHIFLLAGLPPRAPTKWIPLDASVDKPAGWHPPHRMLARIKDYDVP
jgi:hypothetical protein